MLLLSALTLAVVWAPSQGLPDLKTILQKPPPASIPPLTPQVEADLLKKAGLGTRKLLEVIPPLTAFRPYYIKDRLFIDLCGGSNSLYNAMWISAEMTNHLTVVAPGNSPFVNNFLFTYNVEAQSPVTINIDVVPASGNFVRTTTVVSAPTAIGVGVPSGTRQVNLHVVAQNGVGGTLQIDSIGIKDFGP
jgi:hypothetical protein